MKVDLTTLTLKLDAGGTLRLSDARGLSIRAVRGVLWITQEGDGKDHIVGLAECFVVSNAGLTVVSAVTAAELQLQKPDFAPADVTRAETNAAQARATAVIQRQQIRTPGQVLPLLRRLKPGIKPA